MNEQAATLPRPCATAKAKATRGKGEASNLS
jgi:hypothetical protein